MCYFSRLAGSVAQQMVQRAKDSARGKNLPVMINRSSGAKICR
ncbi:hypothetical protein [Collimonas sp. OK307]|nr:hypothetical protein [Collimonas sp. OK307]